jgi:hypothetical protein
MWPTRDIHKNGVGVAGSTVLLELILSHRHPVIWIVGRCAAISLMGRDKLRMLKLPFQPTFIIM